jgi:hypothetical protein
MKFLGLQIDTHIYWKDHIEQMIPKLSAACYAIRSAVHINNINTLKLIYNAHFHSIIKYEIIVWGNSTNSGKIYTLQKKIIRIMAGTQPRNSCRSPFKQLEILPVPCQHILLLMDSIINNHENLNRILLCTISTQGMKKIFKDKMSTCLIFKKVHFMLVSQFSTVYHIV